ncbi:hypothetical protein BJV82DRAFT_707810 [Fennellomyces sp. T-0311]|nr:hypothetical protein BJV82DRAFT_707810 [Fennellomyces sp. T-0311]
MLCCSRCGDMLLTSGKCRKCGGRPVASIIASSGMNSPTIGKEASVKIADKWQSQYASGILGSPHTIFDAKEHQQPLSVKSTVSTPLRSAKRNSIPESLMKRTSRLSLSLQNSCANCSKQLRYDNPSYLESGSYYCQECHISLFSKGACHKCQNPVFQKRDTFVEHNTQVWHKDCFRCYSCIVALGDVPMVDLEGRPCCEPCLMAQSGEAKQKYTIAKISTPSVDNTAASSPVLTSPLRDTVSSAGSFWLPRTPPTSRPRIDSALFSHYQKSLQNNPRNTTPPPPPLTPSSLSPAGSIRSSASASPVSIAPISPSTSPVSVSKADLPPPVRRLSQQLKQNTGKPSTSACFQCGEALHGSKIKMPTADGDIWYHFDCLKCAGCHGNFTESHFVSHGTGTVYHPQCVPAAPEMNSKRFYKCYACKHPIRDKCYQNKSRAYHPQCFQCFKCRTVLPSDKPFFEAFNEPYCEGCINNKKPISAPRALHKNKLTSSTSTPLLSRQQSLDNPSSLLMHRTRALPKLGGSKICPRCNTSIAIMEETLGPKATRWHKKCLRCVGCAKQMDSGAKVAQSSSGEWLVHCRACMDKTGSRAKFVR